MEVTAARLSNGEKLKQEEELERPSAPCAMEWSINLEKGLRSKRPGQPLEAIVQTMERLELWDREPAVNKAQRHMYALIPGEDKLFANSILLRLVDAFSSGDRHIKLFVVKLFLSIRRNRRRKHRQSDGILLKCCLENRLELLRRIKVVFDGGDVESRALSLVLFGCLADVSKDNADIRYLVLSSLVSGDMLQAEASLFAGGCFSELSDDFASVLLEILVNMATTPDVSSTITVAVARAFSNMGSSSSNAYKAYQAGLKLILGSSEEVFLNAMLISLSQLVLRSSRLITEQVSLLSSYITKDRSLGLRVVALRCLHYIAVRGGMCHYPANPLFTQALVDMSNESDSPPALQCGALQLLRKVVLHNLITEACGDMLEFSKILKIFQDAALSPIMAKRHISIRFLVDILVELSASNEKEFGLDFNSLASGTISLIFDEIGLLVELVADLQKFDAELEQKIETLLSLLLVLNNSCHQLGVVVLERIFLLIQSMMNKHDKDVEMVEAGWTIGHEIKESTLQDGNFIKSKLLGRVSEIVNSVLQDLYEDGTISKEVLDHIQLMVEEVHKSTSFDCFSRVAFSFLLHSQISNLRLSNNIEKNGILHRNSPNAIQDCLIQKQNFNLQCAEMVVATKDNWSAYKLGKIAACQGAWSTAAFIFEHLVGSITSDKNKLWIKSLIKFAHSGKILQFFTLPNGCASLSETKIGNLVKACNSLRSSEETMASIAESGSAVIFSRWFLDVRAKFMEYVADTLKLCSLPLSEGNSENSRQGDGNFSSLACDLSQISSKFGRLAKEFDMMATSFMGMDKKSLEIISGNALTCSLLAFITGFSLFFPHLQSENRTKMSEDCLDGMLIQDLGWRLQERDSKISAKLGILLKVCKRPKSSFLHSTNQMCSNSFEAIRLLEACNYAVSQVGLLQNEANGVHNSDKNLVHVSVKGLRLLLDVISQFMLIPSPAPAHFFQERPCISSELIVSNSDTTYSSKGISVSQGSHLSLDICLQLKKAPKGLQIQALKFYCILYCKQSSKFHKYARFKHFGGDDMVLANNRLFGYVKGSTKKATNHKFVETFMRFELNEKGQGFSSCLLDVSGFSLGSYRIQWLSCCVDGEGSYWSLLPSRVGPVFNVVGSDGDRHYGRVYSRRGKN